MFVQDPVCIGSFPDFGSLSRIGHTTRSMSKRRAVVPPDQSMRTTRSISKRNKLTFSEALREQEKAAWDYVNRDRTGEAEETVTADADIDIDIDELEEVEDPNYDFSSEEEFRFLTDIGVIWSDRQPFDFDTKQAQEDAPNKTLRSVLEIVVDHVNLPQSDLINLLSVSWWLLYILESSHHSPIWRSLDLKGVNKAGDRLLKALSLRRYHNVEHISLEAAQDIEDHHLDLRNKGLDSVVSFNVNGCQKISDLGVFYIGSSFPGLKRFSICNNLRVTDICLGTLMRHCRFLTDLNFSGCKNLTDDIFVQLGVWCPTLESLDISRCEQVTDFGPMFLAKTCQHLKHLSLYGCPEVTDKCLKNLSRFYSLTLTSPGENVCTGMKEDDPDKTLSILEIVSNNVKLPQRDLISLLLVSSRLHSKLQSHKFLWLWRFLDFHGMNKAGDRLLAALSLGRYCNVEHLDLESAQDIDDNHFSLLKVMVSVVSLNLDGCPNISDRGVSYIARACPLLQHFSICNNLKVTDNCLKQLGRSCYLLTDLNISGCKNLTDEGLYHIGSLCRRLESLNITGCEQFTDAGISVVTNCHHLIRRTIAASSP